MFHLRKSNVVDPADGSVLLERFGEEGAEEVVEAGEIDDQSLLGDVLLRKDGDVLQGQGNGPELAHGHELQPGQGVGTDACGRKERGNPLHGRSGILETAGEEMHGVLPGAHDGDFLARLLEADARGEARQASADDHGVESHTPSIYRCTVG